MVKARNKPRIRLGNQEPTFERIGAYHHTFGPQAVRLFTGWGIRYYPCQEHELDLFLARDRNNRFACRTICITKPRQNGKSFGAYFYAIWMAAVEGRNVLFTAHRGKTVRKMFKFIRAFVLRVPDLAEKLLPGADGIYRAAGSEGVYFANGGMIEFATRTDGGGRGETYDLIIFDEAQELTDEQYDAVVPTTIASETGDPQKIYLGTPPGPKCRGTVFRAMYDKVHEGATDGIWWIEWAASEVPDMSDVEAVLELAYMTNPALGYRIREDVMLDVIRSATSPDGFAREFLGWWVSTAANVNAVIHEGEWNACKVKHPSRDGLVSYAVRFSADGKRGTLAACHNPTDGKPFVYVIENRSLDHGIEWLVGPLADNWRKAGAIVIDGQSNAKALYERLVKEHVSKRVLVLAKPSDATAAYSGLVHDVREGRLCHYGQPALDRSATSCERRYIGKAGGWGFEGGEDVDASLIEACCWALWGVKNAKRKPGRKAVVR